MEDEFGNAIPDDIRDEVLRDIRGFWSDMLEDGKGNKLKRYNDLGFQTQNDFRVALEGRYPWLRLCDGHWKVYQLWINYFPSWEKSHMHGGPEQPPIDISDEDSEGSSLGSKRGHEDNGEDAAPTKKHKEVATANFHHPRPQPKKIQVKVAKVSEI